MLVIFIAVSLENSYAPFVDDRIEVFIQIEIFILMYLMLIVSLFKVSFWKTMNKSIWFTAASSTK